jgi:hypothetical protein
MNNGSNDWDVSFSRITWLNGALKNHPNVLSVSRHDDIVFEIQRKSGPPITLLCLDEYTLGVSAAERVFEEFPKVNLIYVGGNWNKYTRDAKELCSSRAIGLYNASELNGALSKDDFSTYVRRDKDGTPIFEERSA